AQNSGARACARNTVTDSPREPVGDPKSIRCRELSNQTNFSSNRRGLNRIGHSMPRLSRLVVVRIPALAISIAPNRLLTPATKVTARRQNTFVASIERSESIRDTTAIQPLMVRSSGWQVISVGISRTINQTGEY